jgi:hypothetical protein
MDYGFAELVDKELMLLSIGLVGYVLCKIGKSKKGSSVALTDAEINEAKIWYQSTYQAATDPKLPKQNIEKYAGDWSRKFKPDWQEAQMFNECGTTIIEIPAIKNGEMTLSFSRPGTPELDFNKSGTKTSLLIVKRKMDYHLYAMTIVASAAHLRANHGRLGNNTYQKKDKNFEGAVFFNKMDGTFLNGWCYQNGEATRQLYPSGASYSGIRLMDKRHKAVEDLSTGRSTLIVAALWEDPIYAGNSPIAYKCNTYITTNVYADCPIGEGITIPGGIDETFRPYTVSENLQSRLRLRHELLRLKRGVRNLN